MSGQIRTPNRGLASVFFQIIIGNVLNDYPVIYNNGKYDFLSWFTKMQIDSNSSTWIDDFNEAWGYCNALV